MREQLFLVDKGHERGNLGLYGGHEALAGGVFAGELVEDGQNQRQRVGGGGLARKVRGVEPPGALAHVVQQFGFVREGLVVHLVGREARLIVVGKFLLVEGITEAEGAKFARRQHVVVQEIQVGLHGLPRGGHPVGEGLLFGRTQTRLLHRVGQGRTRSSLRGKRRSIWLAGERRARSNVPSWVLANAASRCRWAASGIISSESYVW